MNPSGESSAEAEERRRKVEWWWGLTDEERDARRENLRQVIAEARAVFQAKSKFLDVQQSEGVGAPESVVERVRRKLDAGQLR